MPDTGIVYPVEKHIHGAKSPRLGVKLLTVDGYLSAGNFLIRFQQQTAASTGRVVDAVVFLGIHQSGNQLRYLAGREEFPAFLSCIRGKHGDHVFIGITNDVIGI